MPLTIKFSTGHVLILYHGIAGHDFETTRDYW